MMSKKRNEQTYRGVNAVLLFVAFVGAGYYLTKSADVQFWETISVSDFLIILFLLLLSQFIKALKLEQFFTGTSLKAYKTLQIYVKTTFVSFIVPFKLGEIFKIYCFVHHTDFAGGFLRVMLDRFLDTCALLTILLFSGVFFSLHAIQLIIFLSIGVFLLVVGYFLFQPQYVYWNELLISHTNSVKTIIALKILDRLYNLYRMVQYISRGRAIMVYFMSLAAWMLEVAAILRVSGIVNEKNLDYSVIGTYFTDILYNHGGIQIQIFTGFSICVFAVLLILLYLFQKGSMKNAK